MFRPLIVFIPSSWWMDHKVWVRISQKQSRCCYYFHLNSFAYVLHRIISQDIYSSKLGDASIRYEDQILTKQLDQVSDNRADPWHRSIHFFLFMSTNRATTCSEPKSQLYGGTARLLCQHVLAASAVLIALQNAIWSGGGRHAVRFRPEKAGCLHPSMCREKLQESAR